MLSKIHFKKTYSEKIITKKKKKKNTYKITSKKNYFIKDLCYAQTQIAIIN